MNSSKNKMVYDHAIVLGGSISGLLVARVLSDFFAKVTVVERDLLPTTNEIRKGAPQARHLHILLAKGAEIMDRLYPELGPRLDQLGAPLFDLGEEILLVMGGEVLRPYTCGVHSRAINRATLEAEIRMFTKQLHNVEFRERTDVLHLVGNGDRSQVVGVAVRGRDGDRASELLEADFVVDATGRRSKSPKWLEELGYEAPAETVINATVGYATRVFQPRDGFQPSWRITAVTPEFPFKPCGGGMVFQEDGTIIMTLLGTAGNLPPLDEAGFAQFARDVHPEFVEVMAQCDPITPISGYRKLENQWRHYEKMTRMPDRFTVIGDAFCAFNPIYGQGMSAVALQAVKLGELLGRGQGNLDGVAHHFIEALPAIVSPAWMLAAGEDLRWPTTTGEPNSLMVRLAPWLSAKIQQAMPRSIAVSQAFVEVQNLLKPSTRFFRPTTLAAIFWHSWRAQMG